MIPRSVRLSEAPSYGVPIMYFDKSNRGTEAYRSLAEELEKITGKGIKTFPESQWRAF